MIAVIPILIKELQNISPGMGVYGPGHWDEPVPAMHVGLISFVPGPGGAQGRLKLHYFMGEGDTVATIFSWFEQVYQRLHTQHYGQYRFYVEEVGLEEKGDTVGGFVTLLFNYRKEV